jgi:anti-anti-sigma factor
MNMEITVERTDEGLAVELAGELNIYAMEKFSENVSDWLLEPAKLILNLEKVTAIDGSGLQILLFLRHIRRKMDRQTVFRNIHDDVNSYLARAGLELTLQQASFSVNVNAPENTAGQYHV